MGATLSVAMIVRNESDFLPECIEGIRPLADEICVVDTGSTDDTLAIAQDAGCRTATFAWNDDFAAARNRSLDLCRGDWVFVLDADERLDGGDFAAFRRLLDAPRDRGYRFTTRNYTRNAQLSGFVPVAADAGEARGFPGWFPSEKVRLFPRHPKIRFEHRVHEVPTASLLRLGFAVVAGGIPVHHYPLLRSESELARKQQVYIALGEAKVRELPGDANARVELGNQYLEAGRYDAALAAFREAVRLDPQSGAHLKDLGNALYLSGKKPEARQAFLLALKLAPDCVDAWRNLGVVHADAGEWREAEQCFAKALALSPQNADLKHYLELMRWRISGGNER